MYSTNQTDKRRKPVLLDLCAGTTPLRSARLLDPLRERIRYKHYSIRSEQQYA
jgi:hypothetical protein